MLYPLSYGGSDACSARDTPLCPKETASSTVPLVALSAETCAGPAFLNRPVDRAPADARDGNQRHVHHRLRDLVHAAARAGGRGVGAHHAATAEAQVGVDVPLREASPGLRRGGSRGREVHGRGQHRAV